MIALTGVMTSCQLSSSKEDHSNIDTVDLDSLTRLKTVEISQTEIDNYGPNAPEQKLDSV